MGKFGGKYFLKTFGTTLYVMKHPRDDIEMEFFHFLKKMKIINKSETLQFVKKFK